MPEAIPPCGSVSAPKWKRALRPAACGYRLTDVCEAPGRPGREFVFIVRRTP